MAYLSEFRVESRALTATFIGLAAGLGYTATTASIFAPHLLAEFNWSMADFALTQSLILVMLIAIPLAGRLADVIGVRRTALIGIISLPLSYLALSAMTGDIRLYLAIYAVQALLCATTTATVYSRIIVDHFKKARGLALAIGASGPGFAGLIVSPLLNEFVDAYGWRAGYQLLALFTLVLGCVVLLIIPARRGSADAATVRARKQTPLGDYRAIARMPVFWILVFALLLCNFPQVFALSQLKLLLQDNGMTGSTISWLISAYSGGILIGRFISGLALDRLPTHIVAAVGLGLPAVGLFLIATPFDTTLVLSIGVLFLGLAYGAEGDILGYVVARYFGIAVFSTVLGLLSATIAISIAVSSALLSVTLGETGSYVLFLTIAGAAVLIGSLMFLLIGNRSPALADEPAGPATA